MPAVRRRPLAREDVLEIWTYVAAENPDAGDAFVDRLDRALPRGGGVRSAS